MRTLKQLLFLLVAVLALNALRFRPAPAQGNGPSVAQSGDTNCDGKIDITDPIIVLNWLFSDGPEPCAVAQGDACCESVQEQIAALRADVAARMPRPDDIVTIRGEVSFKANDKPHVILDVPEGKRFVITSWNWLDRGGPNVELVSILDGQPSDIPDAYDHSIFTADPKTWSTGFALPAGSDVGLKLGFYDNPYVAHYYLNGYFVAE